MKISEIQVKKSIKKLKELNLIAIYKNKKTRLIKIVNNKNSTFNLDEEYDWLEEL